jgi:DNA-binding CsgD family transcriptional regulator
MVVEGRFDAPMRMAWQVSELIASRAMEAHELLDAASALVCRDVADICAVGIAFDDGRKIHPLGLYHRDTERQRQLEALTGLGWESVEGISQRVLQTATPEILGPADLDSAARSRPWAATLLAGSEIHTGVVVAMRALGRHVGIMGLGRSHPHPPFVTDDVRLVQDVADRLGLAVHALHLQDDLERAHAPASGAPEADDRLAGLTSREREVFALIGDGLSSREIGEQLFLSVRTVEWHRARLMHKVGASKRSELIAIGRLLGS